MPQVLTVSLRKYFFLFRIICFLITIQQSNTSTIISNTWYDDFAFDTSQLNGWKLHNLISINESKYYQPDPNPMIIGDNGKQYHGPITKLAGATRSNYLQRQFICNGSISNLNRIYLQYSFAYCNTDIADYTRICKINSEIEVNELGKDICSLNPQITQTMIINDSYPMTDNTFVSNALSETGCNITDWRFKNATTEMTKGGNFITSNTNFTITIKQALNNNEYSVFYDVSLICVPTTGNPTTSNPSIQPTTMNPTIQPTTMNPTTNIPTKQPTKTPVTVAPTTSMPTTANPTTSNPTTANPTTIMPTTSAPTTTNPTTSTPTTFNPTTVNPTTSMPTTSIPTTANPTTSIPTMSNPTTVNPTTTMPTTSIPTTLIPTTIMPTINPTTNVPTTSDLTSSNPSINPSTSVPTTAVPTTLNPTTAVPTNMPTTASPSNPTTSNPTTSNPSINPTTSVPTTAIPTTMNPTTASPSNPTINPITSIPTSNPTTNMPTTYMPSTINPTTSNPSMNPTTNVPTTAVPTNVPTTASPTTYTPTRNPITGRPSNAPTDYPLSNHPTTNSPTTYIPTTHPITAVTTTPTIDIILNKNAVIFIKQTPKDDTIISNPFDRFVIMNKFYVKSKYNIDADCFKCFQWTFNNTLINDLYGDNSEYVTFYNIKIDTVFLANGNEYDIFESYLIIHSINYGHTNNNNELYCSQHSDNSEIIKTHLLQYGNDYNIRLEVCYNGVKNIGSNTLKIVTNQLPFGGYCQIDNLDSLQILSTFNIECFNWTSQSNAHITYNAILSNGVLMANEFVPISQPISGIVSIGDLEIKILIKDSFESITCYNLNVSFPSFTQIVEETGNMTQSINILVDTMSNIMLDTNLGENNNIASALYLVIDSIVTAILRFDATWTLMKNKELDININFVIYTQNANVFGYSI